MAIKINVRLRASAAGAPNQVLTAAKDKLNEAGYLLIEDVALALGKKQIGQQIILFEDEVTNVIEAELRKFANMMRKGVVGVPANQNTPRGVLKTSEMGGSSGAGVDYDVSQSGVRWAHRKPEYLKWKGSLTSGLPKTKKNPRGRGHTRWFEYKEDLKNYLENPEALMFGYGEGGGGFGPISVLFIPELKVVDAKGYTRQAAGTSAGGRFARRFSGYSEPAMANRGVSKEGNAGGAQSEVSVKTGRLVVSVFGNITSDMLPSLATGNVDDIHGDSEALMGLLPANIRRRLDHKPDGKVPYRMVVEPFVSWFLTRAVPYAVNRRLQQVLSTRATRAAAVQARRAR